MLSNQNIDHVKNGFLRDRYFSSLLAAYKMFRTGKVQHLRSALICGLMGANIYDQASVEKALNEFENNMKG